MIKLFARLRYLAAIALFVASYWGFRLVKVEVSEHDRVRARLADELAGQVAGDLPPFEGYPKLVVLPLANDDAGVTREKLRAGLQRAGYNVVQPAWFEQARNWVSTDSPTHSLEQAQAEATDLDAQYALYGSVTKLVTVESNPTLETSLSLVDASDGKALTEKVYRIPAGDAAAAFQFSESRSTPFKWGAAFCWMAIALTVPLVALRLIKRILRRESNERNAALLVAYGLAVAFLGWLLMIKPTAGWIGWAILTVGTLGSLVYFGYLCGQVARAE
jgi:hypothetical protein